ncbi:MAG: bacillithiol biosynthesis BshC, partial [bacterium]
MMDTNCTDPFVQNRLFCDYVSNFQALQDFYTWNPYDPQDWKEALGRLERYPHPRQKLVEVLGRQN